METDWQVETRTPAARSILTTAGRIFYERGISAVGVDVLAAEAGVTKKTLYDQFGSKAALVTAYLTERDQHYRFWIEHDMQDKEPKAQILSVFDALDSWMDAHSTKGCAFVHAHGELLGSPDHPAHDVIQGEKVWLRTLFEDLAAAAGLEEPVCLGSQLLALLEGATVLRSITGQPGAVTAARAAAQVLIGSDPPARAR
jgi:AcrR family transcriptional regulator